MILTSSTLLLVAATALAVAATTCRGPSAEGASIIVHAMDLPVGAEEYAGVAWADDDTLVLGWDPYAPEPDGRSLGPRLVAVGLRDEHHRELPYRRSTRDCDFVRESTPQRIPDGRIAFIRDCLRYDDPVEPFSIHAMDVELGEIEQLAMLGDPWVADGWRTGIGTFSFRPGTAGGVVSVGSVICDGVAEFDADGVRPLDVALDDPDGANLADIWTRPCRDVVNARAPAWAPDGSVIALVISRGVVGHDGQTRLGASYDLELVDAESRQLRRLVPALHEPFRLAWSPDGEHIAVLTSGGLVRTSAGLTSSSDAWLISRASGDIRKLVLSDGRSLADLAWSRDGHRIAGLLQDENLEDGSMTAQPVVIELPAETRSRAYERWSPS